MLSKDDGGLMEAEVIYFNDISIPVGKSQAWVNVYQRADGSVWYGRPRISAERAESFAKRTGVKPAYRIHVKGKPRPRFVPKTQRPDVYQ